MYMLQKHKEPKFGLTCGQFSIVASHYPSITEEHQLPKPGTSANIINNHCKLQVHSYHTESLAAANDELFQVSTQLHREISIYTTTECHPVYKRQHLYYYILSLP